MKKEKTKKYNPIGSSFNEWLDVELTDKEFRKLYESHLAAFDLGSKLKRIASQRGLSVRGLASKMKTSPSQVQRMFSENAVKCSIESLMKFALVTGCELPDLFNDKAA